MGILHVVSRDKTLTSKMKKRIRLGMSKAGSKTKVMFVTAHPDDEVMFFSPTILNHVVDATKYEVYILCLSTGDFYNQGHLRTQELYDSCNVLGVKLKNVFVVDDVKLPDGQGIKWDKKYVAQLVQEYVENEHVNVLFTFDRHGVSGHSNHIDVYEGVQYLIYDENCPEHLQAFQLVSISLFRKYLSVLDTFYSYVTSSLIFTSPWLQVWKSQQAMYAHWSQFVWFRVLYVLFSRYMIINTYEPIDVPIDID